MDALTLRVARASEPKVAALIETHFALMRVSSPEESCHVMEATSLDAEGATVIVAEDQGAVLGVGALKRIGDRHAEIKSMHTAQAARGRGVARAILRALIEHARAQGYTRVSLETGSADLFAPARTLYLVEGFEIVAPFGSYVEDPLSVFMSRRL